MKQIELTQGKMALVDDDMFDIINQRNWYVLKDGNTFYATSHLTRKDNVDISKRPVVWMHHLVVGKPPKGFEVDHIDGDGLNNQRYNLRIVTKRVNHHNQIAHRNGRLVGCYYNKYHKKWKAEIMIDGHRKFLGYYSTELEAHEVYMKAFENLSI